MIIVVTCLHLPREWNLVFARPIYSCSLYNIGPHPYYLMLLGISDDDGMNIYVYIYIYIYIYIKQFLTGTTCVIRISLGWAIDRSFTPIAPYTIGNTSTFIWRRRGQGFESHIERFFYRSAWACVPEHIYLPGSLGIETKRLGQRAAVYGTDAPKIPPFRGGESVTRITLDWVIDRYFTPIAQ